MNKLLTISLLTKLTKWQKFRCVCPAPITVISVQEKDYISLTDMANAKESESRAADIIKNWLRTRYAI